MSNNYNLHILWKKYLFKKLFINGKKYAKIFLTLLGIAWKFIVFRNQFNLLKIVRFA